MKVKKKLVLVIIGMILISGKCKNKGQQNTIPDGENDPSGVTTASSYIMLSDVDFYCDNTPALFNPCESVINSYGNSKLQIKVKGTFTSWEQVSRWDGGSIYPTTHSGSTGTTIYYNNTIDPSGCIYFEYPEGEDFNIYVTYIEGQDLDCTPDAGLGCWRWDFKETIPKNFITFTSCGGSEEYVIDLSAVTPTKGSCNY